MSTKSPQNFRKFHIYNYLIIKYIYSIISSTITLWTLWTFYSLFFTQKKNFENFLNFMGVRGFGQNGTKKPLYRVVFLTFVYTSVRYLKKKLNCFFRLAN